MENLFDASEVEELKAKAEAVRNAHGRRAHLRTVRTNTELELSSATIRSRVDGAALAAKLLGEPPPPPSRVRPAEAPPFQEDELRAALVRLKEREADCDKQVTWAEDEFRRAFLEVIRAAMNRVGEKYAPLAAELFGLWRLLEGLDSILRDAGGPMSGLLPQDVWRSIHIPGATQLPSIAKATEDIAIAWGGPRIVSAADYKGTRQTVAEIASEAMRTIGTWPFNRRIG